MSAVSWGCTAYRHATWTLVIGMGNQPYRVEETGGWSRTSTRVVRARSHGWVKKDKHWVLSTSKDKYVPEGDATHDRMLQSARRAAEYRAGNCAEHAAVVYAHLWEKARGKGLGLVSRVTCNKPGDHAFVVIGRDPSGDGSIHSWGPNAVVVDAWGRFVADGSDIENETGEYYEGEDEDGIERVQKYINYHDVCIRCEFDSDA